MFCPQCGKENQKAGAFCIYCGNKLPVLDGGSAAGVASSIAQQIAAENASCVLSDAYRKLGGGLAALSYGRLLSAVLELMICIVVTFTSTCFKYRPNGSREFIGILYFFEAAAHHGISSVTVFCYGSLFVIFLYVLLVCCSIIMHRKIKARKANCMSFYRGVAVIISCATIAGFAATYLLIRNNPGIIYNSRFAMIQTMPIIVIAVWLILDMIISLLIFRRYFKTSKRVKVYFETTQ